MKIKLDENVTVASKALLAEAGHEVDSVVDEGISGAHDELLAEVCARECRLLVTFDLGLGDVRTHPPGTPSRHRVVAVA